MLHTMRITAFKRGRKAKGGDASRIRLGWYGNALRGGEGRPIGGKRGR